MRIGIGLKLPKNLAARKRPSSYDLIADDGTPLTGFTGSNPDSNGVTAEDDSGGTFGVQGSITWTIGGVDYVMNTVIFNTTT